MPMTKKQLCEEIKKYDFDNNTIINFSKIFNVSISTVQRYRKECGLQPKFQIGIKKEIDNKGRFCLHNEIKINGEKSKIIPFEKSKIIPENKTNKKFKDLKIKEKEDLVDQLFNF